MSGTLSFTKKHKYWFLLGLMFVFFISLHLFGIHAPYHQDEYKWVFYSHPELVAPGTVAHPPLTEFIYTRIGPIVGDSNFRFIPFFFGILDFFLLFYLAKIIFDKKTALWVTFLFTISFYSLLATLMVDVDGAIMPFFFLLLAVGYFKWKQLGTESKNKWKWILLMLIGAIGGFMIKVSAILPIVAIFLDFVLDQKVFSDKKKIFKYLGYAVLGAIALVLLLFGAKLIFPFFNLEYAFKYWEHFVVFSGRGWLQTFIQFFKSILYTSPLLVIPAFLINKDIWKKTRVFFIFIFFGLFFYLIAFDFSGGALDRYFQFLIVPLAIISGAVFANYFENHKARMKSVFLITVASIIVFLIQFINNVTPPLYPKTEWVHRALSLKLNFLFPFMGGSGPLPFYISFAFITICWVVSVVLFLIYFTKKDFKALALTGILILGVSYNAAFIEEYLFGGINGSAVKLVMDSEAFIASDKDIKQVTVYNDNGGYNIMQTGKYHKRLYIDPKFDITNKVEDLNQYKEHYLVIDIPHIDPNSVYAKYFDSCPVVFSEQSGAISAKIYDCRKAPDLKI